MRLLIKKKTISVLFVSQTNLLSPVSKRVRRRKIPPCDIRACSLVKKATVAEDKAFSLLYVVRFQQPIE